MPNAYSYSALDTYSKCPLKYKYSYIDKMIPTIMDYTGTVPGNVIHTLIELFAADYIQRGRPDWTLFKEHFDAIFNKYADANSTYFSSEAFASSKSDARKKIWTWTENAIDMLKLQKLVKRIIISEHRWSKKNPAILSDKVHLTGGFDWFATDDKATPGLLPDFKASDSTFHLNFKQVYLYGMGLEKTLGYKVGMVGYLLFKSRRAHWLPLSQDKRVETLIWAEQQIAGIEGLLWEARPGETACKLCNFKRQCSFYRPPVTKNSMKEGIVSLGEEREIPEL